MKLIRNLFLAALLLASPAIAQTVVPGGGSGAPSGPAAGVLSGNYPNPGLNAACADLSNEGPYCAAALGQMPGVATNFDATAGNIGEFLSHTAGAVSLTTNVPQNGATLALTAGDWDVSCGYSASGSGTPVASDIWVSINTTTIVPINTAGQSFRIRGFNMTDPVLAGSVGPLRVSLASTTNYYCVMQATFSPGTFSPQAVMVARRRR